MGNKWHYDKQHDEWTQRDSGDETKPIVPKRMGAQGGEWPDRPIGENPKKRFGDTKPPMGFVPPVALLQLGVVMRLGAEKYGPFNWHANPVEARTYYDAAMRHLMSWYGGEETDPESGASHLAHVMACCSILLDAATSGKLRDNRPPMASPAKAIAELTQSRGAPKNDRSDTEPARRECCGGYTWGCGYCRNCPHRSGNERGRDKASP